MCDEHTDDCEDCERLADLVAALTAERDILRARVAERETLSRTWVIPADEFARMRRDAEMLAAARFDERGKPVPVVSWGSRSCDFRPEADVLVLLNALITEQVRADRAEAQVAELEQRMLVVRSDRPVSAPESA